LIEALKCLIVKDGLIYLIDKDYAEKVSNISSDDVSINVMEQGVAVILKYEITIHVPEEILDYVVENRNITLYTFAPGSFIEEPVITIVLSRDALIEARSIYRYSKRINSHLSS